MCSFKWKGSSVLVRVRWCRHVGLSLLVWVCWFNCVGSDSQHHVHDDQIPCPKRLLWQYDAWTPIENSRKHGVDEIPRPWWWDTVSLHVFQPVSLSVSVQGCWFECVRSAGEIPPCWCECVGLAACVWAYWFEFVDLVVLARIRKSGFAC